MVVAWGVVVLVISGVVVVVAWGVVVVVMSGVVVVVAWGVVVVVMSGVVVVDTWGVVVVVISGVVVVDIWGVVVVVITGVVVVDAWGVVVVVAWGIVVVVISGVVVVDIWGVVVVVIAGVVVVDTWGVVVGQLAAKINQTIDFVQMWSHDHFFVVTTWNTCPNQHSCCLNVYLWLQILAALLRPIAVINYCCTCSAAKQLSPYSTENRDPTRMKLTHTKMKCTLPIPEFRVWDPT